MTASGTSGSPSMHEWLISPVNAQVFPWVMPLAASFEEYRIKYLRVYHEPVLPATTSGYVGLAFSYNAQDTIPQDELEFFTYEEASRTSIWSPIAVTMRGSKWLFTQPLEDPTNFDLKTFAAGKLFGVCLTSEADVVCGQMFMDIDVEFRKPRRSQYIATTASGGVLTDTTDVTGHEPFDGPPTYGSTALVKVDKNRYTANLPGRYLMPTTASFQNTAAGSLAVGAPLAATVRSQLKDVAIGYQAADNTFVLDETYGNMELASDPTLFGTNGGAGDGSCTASWDWVFEAIKPGATVNTEKAGDGTSADYLNASSGWGDLWDTVDAGIDIAIKAAPYLLEAVSFFLTEEDIQYERERKQGLHSEYHGGEGKARSYPLLIARYAKNEEEAQQMLDMSPADLRRLIDRKRSQRRQRLENDRKLRSIRSNSINRQSKSC